MHYAIGAILLAVSSAVAAPVEAEAKPAYPTPTFTCPKGMKAHVAHFDDLAVGKADSHPVRPSPAPYAGVYQNLYYGYYDWQVVSKGNQALRFGGKNDPIQARFNMTAHSGSNAIATTEAEQLSIGHYYGGNYFHPKSVWVRSQNSDAFTFRVVCDTSRPDSFSVPKEFSFKVPAPAKYGDFYQVKFNAAQQKAFEYSINCNMGSVNFPGGQRSQIVLIDDISYCMYVAPGNPV